MSRNTVVQRVLEFLANYGEKGYIVLRSAVEATLKHTNKNTRNSVRLGDFSYRDITSILRENGLKYNPSMLLRVMEKDYGIIETSYHSSNQRWWNFIDLASTIEALEQYEKGVEPGYAEETEEEIDPEIEAIRAQFVALGVDEILEKLEKIVLRAKPTKQDRIIFSKIVFNYLDTIVKLYNKMMEYEDEFSEELSLLHEIIVLISKTSKRLALLQKSRGRSTLKRINERRNAVSQETIIGEGSLNW